MFRQHITDNFHGLLVIGDIHGDFESFEKACKYADENNYFLLSLGDLVDRGRRPYEVVSLMHSLMEKGKAGLTIGNHDDKFRRYAHGNKVTLSYDARITLEDVGKEREDEFLNMYLSITTNPILSALYYKLDNFVFIHAATHSAIWDSSVKFTDDARSKALYGETNGERYDDGFPVRLYTWVDEIPSDKTVIVGHDRMPLFGDVLPEPLVHKNASGGTVVFMDTGCGKSGFLSGVVIKCSDSFAIDQFIDFRTIK